MAHTQEAPAAPIDTKEKTVKLWIKRLGFISLVIIGISIIIKMIGGIPFSSIKDGGWVTVERTTCAPTWNQDRGWCTVVSDAAKGTYRIVPRYKSWQLWQNDGNFSSVPPHGLDVYAHWGNETEFLDEFHRTAHKSGSNNYGALIVRIGNMEIIEALNSSRMPREFEVIKDGTEIAINVNLTPLINFYKNNTGEIQVEVQRQD
jgi:hypothetical protein